MRGTHLFRLIRNHRARIIPAYAGNTWIDSFARAKKRDHPRVCGEHHMTSIMVHLNWGSSPRMRGTPQVLCHYSSSLGIIPAYAGNTVSVGLREGFKEDHPRVCGEHGVTALWDKVSSGSSPRMRGTQYHHGVGVHGRGIIPAYAGNTRHPNPRTRLPRDHPRVCGEHQERGHTARPLTGSSPRMRGTQIAPCGAQYALGIIPAYAGNTLRD